MICANCGAANRDGAKFCSRCALPLEATASPPDADQVAIKEVLPPLAPSDAVSTAIEQRVQNATPVEPVNEPRAATLPLAIGAKLQDRYAVLEILSSDADKTVYRARDEWRCPDPTCGAENPTGETFCQNCGRELNEHPTCLIEERAAPTDRTTITPPSFVSGNRLYTIQVEAPAETVAPKPFPSGVRLSYALKSDVGLVRGSGGGVDEDSVFAFALSAIYESIATPTIGLFFVADGIGGSDAGEVASKLCAQTIAPELLAQIIAPIFSGKEMDAMMVRGLLEEAILKTNHVILQAAAEKANDMGTTLTLALVINTQAYIASIGDSRTYLFADGKLKPITRDHSLVAKLVEEQMIQPQDVYTHPNRNVIFRSLGAKADLDVDIFPADGGALELKPGMRLLLCCDGLWEMVHDDELEEEMLRELDAQKLCDRLIARANQAGGEDNISLVVVNIEQ